jgi:hypothetical protein
MNLMCKVLYIIINSLTRPEVKVKLILKYVK